MVLGWRHSFLIRSGKLLASGPYNCSWCALMSPRMSELQFDFKGWNSFVNVVGGLGKYRFCREKEKFSTLKSMAKKELSEVKEIFRSRLAVFQI